MKGVANWDQIYFIEIGGVAYLDNKQGSQFLPASFTFYVPQNIECRRHPNE